MEVDMPTALMPEDRAAIVAWQLFGGSASLERLKDCLETQAKPEWNRAVRFIAGAIREAVTVEREEMLLEVPAFQEPYPWPT